MDGLFYLCIKICEQVAGSRVSVVKKLLLGILFCLSLGCSDREGIAPVSESRYSVQNKNQQVHRVQAGETLYAIAFRYDKDYQQLADYNQLSSPYSLRVGQTIRLPHTQQIVRPHYMQAPRYVAKSYNSNTKNARAARSHYAYQPVDYSSAHALSDDYDWAWPVHGRILTNFLPSQGKKGIDIASKKGEGVYTSAPGVVAYAGSGLLGYGNLIIIKHSNQYLTAYGNNSKNLVHEGQRISSGQRIAEVGVIDRRFWGVHFEIRQAGRPVNPLKYLKQSYGMK